MRTPLLAAALAGVLIVSLAGCPGGKDLASVAFDPKADLFSPNPDGPGAGTLARTFECTQRAPNGECLQNECKQGPGGATFDCASFAAACVNAGEHWSGTKEGGKCTKVL